MGGPPVARPRRGASSSRTPKGHGRGGSVLRRRFVNAAIGEGCPPRPRGRHRPPIFGACATSPEVGGSDDLALRRGGCLRSRQPTVLSLLVGGAAQRID